MHIDDGIVRAVRIEQGQCLENTVGAGRVRGVSQDSLAAGILHSGNYFLVARSDYDGTNIGLTRPLHDVNDHRFAVDIGHDLIG